MYKKNKIKKPWYIWYIIKLVSSRKERSGLVKISNFISFWPLSHFPQSSHLFSLWLISLFSGEMLWKKKKDKRNFLLVNLEQEIFWPKRCSKVSKTKLIPTNCDNTPRTKPHYVNQPNYSWPLESSNGFSHLWPGVFHISLPTQKIHNWGGGRKQQQQSGLG